jgi:hypothetical protein
MRVAAVEVRRRLEALLHSPVPPPTRKKMKTILISTILALSIPVYANAAAAECDKSASYGRKIYLQKRLGMTLKRYREIEGDPPHPVLDNIEKAIFQKNIKSEDHAALIANTVCNKYFVR